MKVGLGVHSLCRNSKCLPSGNYPFSTISQNHLAGSYLFDLPPPDAHIISPMQTKTLCITTRISIDYRYGLQLHTGVHGIAHDSQGCMLLVNIRQREINICVAYCNAHTTMRPNMLGTLALPCSLCALPALIREWACLWLCPGQEIPPPSLQILQVMFKGTSAVQSYLGGH